MIKISGILAINNAISLGYPFIEAVLSILPITDEFLINDGGSKDKTGFYLKKLQKTFPDKIQLFNKPFSASGNFPKISVLDESINFLIDKANGNWIFEAQGDELWHEKDILKIKKTIEKASKKGCNSIRAIRKGADFQAIGSNSQTLSQHVIYKMVPIVRKIKGLISGDAGGEFCVAGLSCKPPNGFDGSNVPPELVTNFVYFNMAERTFPDNALSRGRAYLDFFGRKGVLGRITTNPPIKQKSNPEIVKKLPALIQGLASIYKYKVRKELFDKKFLKKLTGLNY